MGQEYKQDGCNDLLLQTEVIKKYMKNIDEETLYELSLQLYEFTKLIVEKTKHEN